MAFQLAHSFIFRFWTLQPQTNYLENWKLNVFLITTQDMVFVFVCLLSAWSYLEKIDKGTIFWSIHHILAWFFSKMCFAIGLIAPGCCYTHNVIICVATSVICEKACIEVGAIFRLSQTCWKLVLTWLD